MVRNASDTMDPGMSTDPPTSPQPPGDVSAEPAVQPAAATATPSGSGTHRTPTVATPVPSDAAVSESDWTGWALDTVTCCIDPVTGEAHPAGASLWLDAAAQRFAHHASRLTRRTVTLYRMAEAASFENHLDGFAVKLTLGPGRGFVVLALDVAAAQGLASPLIADATGLQPPASPGPTDVLDATALGLLEFLTLAGADAVLSDLAPDTPPAIQAFGGVEFLKHHPREQRRAEIGFRVHVGSVLGELRVALIDADEELTAELGRTPALPTDPSFGVGLALPGIPLSLAEQQAAAAGDVLLLGAADLAALAQHAELVTTTGWSLGPAQLNDLQPDHLTVTPGQLTPRPMVPDAAWRPVLGRFSCTAQALRELAPGDALRLVIDADAPITFVAQGRVVGRGEPVAFEGQAGVRLLETIAPWAEGGPS